MPQIIMLNHASYVNRENSERKAKASRPDREHNPILSAEEQRVNNLSPTELSNYLSENWE